MYQRCSLLTLACLTVCLAASRVAADVVLDTFNDAHDKTLSGPDQVDVDLFRASGELFDLRYEILGIEGTASDYTAVSVTPGSMQVSQSAGAKSFVSLGYHATTPSELSGLTEIDFPVERRLEIVLSDFDPGVSGSLDISVKLIDILGTQATGTIVRFEQASAGPTTAGIDLTPFAVNFDRMEEMYVQFDYVGGASFSINEVRLVSVPEPASATLLAVVSAVLTMRSRRRQA